MKILNEDMLTRVEEAARFARKWHMGQCRPNTSQEPKIDHIEEVARLVTDAGGGYLEIMAAWLHDIVEDTAVTLEDIAEIFGSEVEILIDGLTDPPKFVDLPLAQHKDLQVQRLRNIAFESLCE